MFLWTDLAEIIRRPLGALKTIDARRSLPAGLVALALSVALPAAVAELAALGPYHPPASLGSLGSLTALGVDIYARWVYQHRFLLPLYGLAVSLVLWLVAAGLIHLIVRALDGRGSFLGYLKLVGYAALTGVVVLPVTIVDALLKLGGPARAELAVGQLAGLLGIGIFLWQNLLLVEAARAHYGVSTERAVAAVIGPIACVIILVVGLVILATVLTVLSRQAPL